ncbi:hypothetical protein HDU93_001197 [Gonapodya sp. JEL0774]|nr:hypothetical protein HDU93_001197 [Gonapodya sp. JEL0774]
MKRERWENDGKLDQSALGGGTSIVTLPRVSDGAATPLIDESAFALHLAVADLLPLAPTFPPTAAFSDLRLESKTSNTMKSCSL